MVYSSQSTCTHFVTSGESAHGPVGEGKVGGAESEPGTRWKARQRVSRDCAGPSGQVGVPGLVSCVWARARPPPAEPVLGEAVEKEEGGITCLLCTGPSLFPVSPSVSLERETRMHRLRPLQPLIPVQQWWEKPETQGARRAALALWEQQGKRSSWTCTCSAPTLEPWGPGRTGGTWGKAFGGQSSPGAVVTWGA